MQPAGAAHLFGAAPPEFLKEFRTDRALMTAGMRRATPADARAHLATVLNPFPKLLGWIERVAAFGHAVREELSSGEALAEAARASEYATVQVEAGQGFDAGTPVTVAATDYATDLVSGALVGLTNDQVTIERSDPRAGTVHVHFPRIGYQIKKSDT
jgi:hypothetical protein